MIKDAYTKRKWKHDYRSVCQYHIILKKNPQHPDFGKIIGDPDIPVGQPGEASVDKTLLGKIIGSHFFNIDKKYPFIKCIQYRVMPDHVHVYLKVIEYMEQPLGYYIGRVKYKIAEEYGLKVNKSLHASDIFTPNFTDKILYAGTVFKRVIDYIILNPYKRAMVMKYPEYFERKVIFNLDGMEYEAFGNIFLLNHPFKLAYKFYRRLSAKDNQQIGEYALEHIDSGGVLVSPFFNDYEKEIRRKAMEKGGKIIRLDFQELGERFKPGSEEFKLCSTGKLLIIAPKVSLGKSLTYEIGSKMNALAQRIADL